MTQRSPFRYFKTSPEIIRLAVMMYVRFPLSLRNVEDLLHERGIDISHECVRFWWNRFGPIFASEIRKRRVEGMRSSRWRWHLDEVFVKINGQQHYLWRAVDHEGEVLESFVTKRRNKKAALKFLKKSLKRHGRAEELVTDRLRSYGAALNELGIRDRQESGRWKNNRGRICTSRSEDGSGRCCISGECEVCKNSPLFTHRSSTISTRSAIYTADRISSLTAQLPSPSGATCARPNRLQFLEN
ncbi:IS6 family transposase [Hoeflea sp.]|uniref:IS6 family transposase n=1 Tax=Hoeflea sp. TaxID=1940281 RepID=UPI0025BCAD61|nr:IS6 family transposase [Hoeflea sp.]